MKLLTVFVLFSLCVAAFAMPTVEETRMLFDSWKRHHSKVYDNAVEHSRRFQVFSDNLAFVTKHNEEAAQGKHSYTLGMNHLADLTNAEYRSMYLNYRRNPNRPRYNNHTSIFATMKAPEALPASVDWRDKGCVTPVKDQGQCGSCWSFSATGAMEGAYTLKHGGPVVSLSEQNLVDCVKGGQYTCDTGGEMQDGFQYVIDNNGIESEADYPYCACSGNQCQFDASKVAATITSFKVVTEGSESALQTATAGQPVSIAIDASSQQFQLYSGGVFDLASCSSTQLDHGVLIVGYGTYNGAAYWLVKNSWSASWGLQGYIMMSRNKNNQCGVATDASFPIA